jgi:vancomycin resistance protein VanW
MHLRNLIPKSVRLAVKLVLRRWDDERSGMSIQFARSNTTRSEERIVSVIEIQQQVAQSAFFENKVQNMRLAAHNIGRIRIGPGEIFSFWRIVGPPSSKRGFKEGRNLVNGQLRSAVGGGLCQVSSLLYYLSLKAQLAVVERHHHSLDIYAEAERVAPLGSDATVVYGYKDLRVRNDHDFGIWIEVEVQDGAIVGRLRSEGPLVASLVEFRRTETLPFRKVETFVDDKLVARHAYRIWQAAPIIT